MSELCMRICGLLGHGELKREWYQYSQSRFIVRHSEGEYITSCKRCGMIVNIER